jgi:hypothetical protein
MFSESLVQVCGEIWLNSEYATTFLGFKKTVEHYGFDTKN